MSHVAKVEIEIRSLTALAVAAAACGLELRADQKFYRWWGSSVGDYPMPEGMTAEQLGRCDAAISVPGVVGARSATENGCSSSLPWEVGVVQRGESYSLMFDFFAGGNGLVERLGGPAAERLVGEYALAAAAEAATAQGWMSQRDGNELVIYHPDGGCLRVDYKGGVDLSGFSGADCIAAGAPIESALGSVVEVARKREFYDAKMFLTRRA